MSRLILIAAMLSSFAVGCGNKGPTADPKIAAEAKQIWDTRCVTCHGKAGKGDGPGAAALDPKPRSFGDKKWQAETNDDRIKKVIVEGGAAVGLNPTMAPNPDLAEKPQVVAELVNIVRGFK